MSYTVAFQQVDQTSLPLVGGKGANLGEMKAAGFPVPLGFCVTTEAFNRFIAMSPAMEHWYRKLDELNVDDLEALRHLGESVREYLQGLPIPQDVADAVVQAWEQLGAGDAYAVRSSATAEDLPGTSFAGQQETYLNVIGKGDLLNHIRLCWVSLFTDRAIAYRSKNGFDHRKVALAVVVQKMIFPEVSGILFTADPVSGNRKVSTIDAGYGLGEALVSGLISPDLYKVKDGQILEKKIGDKKLGIYGLPAGGTEKREIPGDKAKMQALTDEQIIGLAGLGRQIESHYGAPQDIEWALAGGKFYIVQSRPITSLYPVPEVVDPEFVHVYFSFGHQQMMTEALKPLAISALRTFLPFGKETAWSESRFMQEAGSHLFVDITYILHMPLGRRNMPKGIKNLDDMMSSALIEFVKRPDFMAGIRKHPEIEKNIRRNLRKVGLKILHTVLARNPQSLAPELNQYIDRTIASNKEKLAGTSGFKRIRAAREIVGGFAIEELFEVFPYPVTGIVTMKALENLIHRWVGETDLIPKLSQSFSGNVTTEMGLRLGDLAEAARPYPEVIAYLAQATDENFYSGLEKVAGGEVFLKAFHDFLAEYGMRCPGEIDITVPRWREVPTQLVPAILSHIRSSEPNEHRIRFREGEREAVEAEAKILEAVRKRRGGFLKHRILARLIKVYRSTMALREHIKYMIIQHLDICREGILAVAEELVRKGLLASREDVYYLSLAEVEELAAAAEGNKSFNGAEVFLNMGEISKRKEKYEHDRKLTPPRVITSEGEILTGMRSTENLPPGALAGQPVSAGVVEGRARVVLRPEEGKLDKGDILIAPFTDPGWTPLFLSASGLVMEVGGLMTHGAVVAREYGLPAVVGVDGATNKIQDGQHIRVNGNLGYVEIL
ncbi:phosphoenolpyruvate synthase [Paradesulfitobacterium ferrireducens]|uniref:phosphoenolpyruvate synthase n=1 Tax=Paradesulfitobacterium ferrireducens TaxID=2816476 RepID=UPI001A8D30D2|nr:phosphoenolpyruvate synthase [Paradesulfitobacterium ferrireducens]